jgi:hypothetical protein
VTRSFLHPEESGDAKFVKHLISSAMAERDGDDDHRLSMEEFENGLWHELRPWNPTKYDSYGFHDYEVGAPCSCACSGCGLRSGNRNRHGTGTSLLLGGRVLIRKRQDAPVCAGSAHHPRLTEGLSHARGRYSQSYHDEEENPEKAAMEHDEMKKRFSSLDANGDGHIDVEELRAELHSLHPSEAVFAQRQAAHLVEQADEDKDLHLTLDEMLANPVSCSCATPLTEQGEGGGGFTWKATELKWSVLHLRQHAAQSSH